VPQAQISLSEEHEATDELLPHGMRISFCVPMHLLLGMNPVDQALTDIGNQPELLSVNC
jgi:hypothetical protein